MKHSGVHFAPGQLLAVVTPATVVVVDAPTDWSLAGPLWELTLDDAPIDEILDLLIRRGIRTAPTFAIVRVDDGFVRVLVRGPVRVQVERDGEPVRLDASGATTWLEAVVSTPRRVLIGDVDAQTLTPYLVATGVVLTGGLVLPCAIDDDGRRDSEPDVDADLAVGTGAEAGPPAVVDLTQFERSRDARPDPEEFPEPFAESRSESFPEPSVEQVPEQFRREPMDRLEMLERPVPSSSAPPAPAPAVEPSGSAVIDWPPGGAAVEASRQEAPAPDDRAASAEPDAADLRVADPDSPGPEPARGEEAEQEPALRVADDPEPADQEAADQEAAEEEAAEEEAAEEDESPPGPSPSDLPSPNRQEVPIPLSALSTPVLPAPIDLVPDAPAEEPVELPVRQRGRSLVPGGLEDPVPAAPGPSALNGVRTDDPVQQSRAPEYGRQQPLPAFFRGTRAARGEGASSVFAPEQSERSADRAGGLEPPHEPVRLLGVWCDAGHVTSPDAPECRVCGLTVPEQPAIMVARPTLGVLVLDNGDRVPVDRPVVLGRDPKPVASPDQEPPLLHQVSGGTGQVSRTHAEVRASGWDVVVTDLDALNGTTVTPPGGETVALDPGDVTPIVAGTRVEMGGEVSFVLEVES